MEKVAEYKLGSIHNKYLILDIVSYAFGIEDSIMLLKGTSHVFRKLMIKNYRTFSKNYPEY